MDLDEAMKKRRSIRRFQRADVSARIVEEVLDLCRYAPSSMNGQPWHFLVVRREQTKKRLVEIKNRYCPQEKKEFKADFMLGAPVVVVIGVDRTRSFDRAVENGVLAASHLMLAAHSRGLGSVYMSAQKADDPGVSNEIAKLLGLGESIAPIAIIPLGYPDELPPPKDLRPLAELIHGDDQE